MEGCFKVPLVKFISLFTSIWATVDPCRDTYGMQIPRVVHRSTPTAWVTKETCTVKTKCDPHICAAPVEAELKAWLKKCKHKNTSINKDKDSPKQTTCKDLPECFMLVTSSILFTCHNDKMVCLWSSEVTIPPRCALASAGLFSSQLLQLCVLLTWCLPSNNRISFHYLFSKPIGVLYRQAIFTEAAHLQYRQYTMCTFLTLHSAALLSSQGSDSGKSESDESWLKGQGVTYEVRKA